MPEIMSIFNGLGSFMQKWCETGHAKEKARPDKGAGFSAIRFPVIEELFFFLFQSGTEDVAKAGTGIG
tara:strand:- start:26 stop:229 length:204 start_codon:yes stop_codon:yes gene_type:complete